MDYFDLAPGEVWEDRYDPQHEEGPAPAPSCPPLTDEELAALAPWM